MIGSELIGRISIQNPHLYRQDAEKVVNIISGEITAAMARGERGNPAEPLTERCAERDRKNAPLPASRLRDTNGQALAYVYFEEEPERSGLLGMRQAARPQLFRQHS